MFKFILLVGLFLTQNSFATKAQIKVIYGEDDRLDVYQVSNLYQNWASSTAAMIESTSIVGHQEYGQYQIIGESLGDMGICPSERFYNQITAARCSGFLVAPNVLVTAGHCVQSESDCTEFKWVFDYKLSSPFQAEIIVDANDIYSCKKVISQKLEEGEGADFAVIELDRQVVNRVPLPVRTSGNASINDELVVIGHPSGLPTKVADGAHVRSVNDTFLVANLDTYGGNSGSAVINTGTGQVEGILVRGDDDYIETPEGCRVSNVQGNDEGRGEDVTLITIVEGIKLEQKPATKKRHRFLNWLRRLFRRNQ